MAYKSGHIYLIDHEPSNEEVANFAKPVEFYVSENGKYYSILYDKNGNKYVQDASKIVTGFIKIGEITQDGNTYTIGVHPSGFNHWRINGVDVTTAFPSVLEVEPVSTGKFRVDYIVGNSGGGMFILPGAESKFPTEINPMDYPSFAFFQKILVTPDGLGNGGFDPSLYATVMHLDAEIVNRSIADNNLQTQINGINNQKSSVVDKMLHYWDSTAGKWLSSGVSYLSGRIGIGKDPVETLDVNGRTKANSFMLAENVAVSVPYELGRKAGRLGYAGSDGIFREILIVGQTYEHQIRGKVLTATATGTYNCDLNSYTCWILTLTGNTSIAFTNMILEDETVTISMSVTGNFTLTFPSWLKQSADSYIYDGAKINRITIEIGRGGLSPSGRFTLEKYDS